MIQKNWKNLPLRLSSIVIVGFFLIPSLSAGKEKAYKADEAPHPLKDIKITERLGQSIDFQLAFKNENDETIRLEKYFGSGPVLMSVVYYNCPSLCNFHLNGLFEGLEKLSASGWEIPYQLVILSMDDTEKATLAKEKKSNYLKEFKGLKENSIHFLTGSSENIKKLTDSLGFAFRWDEETEQFAHSPVAYTLSPKAVISRYLYGIEFLPKTLKLSLLEAGEGKIGNMIDRILLFCYRFNSRENKYTLYAVNIMRAGGVLMILTLMLWLIPVWMKERKKIA